MDTTGIALLALSAIVVFIGIALMPAFGPGVYTYIVLIICLMTAGLLLVINFADFLVFPIAMRILGIVFKPSEDYKIIKTQDAVVKNVSGINYAIGYLTGNLFAYEFKAEQQEENIDDKITDAPDTWERAVMSIDFPFKFHVLSCARDVQEARDELEGKRSYQEFQMNRAMQGGKTTDVEITDLQRKLNIIQTQIDRIGQGERPISAVIYIETIAVGVSEKEALDNLTAQASRLQIALSSLDISLSRVIGRELYTLFKFNFALPTTRDEVAQYFDAQG